MRHQVFENFVTTVGTNGTVTFPLRDASNSGIPLLEIGPAYRRNPIRFFVRMPTLEEASRLPAPLKYDRNTITFEPLMLYVGNPLPPHCTVQFSRIVSSNQRGRFNKKPLHLWNPQEDTSIYPASPIQIPALRPEEALEFEGVSYWYNDQPARLSKSTRAREFTYPLPPEPPPCIRSRYPAHLMLLVRMKWLPRETEKKSFRMVNGSPVGANTPTAPMTPEAPEMNLEPSSWKSRYYDPTVQDEEDDEDLDSL